MKKVMVLMCADIAYDMSTPEQSADAWLKFFKYCDQYGAEFWDLANAKPNDKGLLNKITCFRDKLGDFTKGDKDFRDFLSGAIQNYLSEKNRGFSEDDRLVKLYQKAKKGDWKAARKLIQEFGLERTYGVSIVRVR